jgi:hypothetical protein
MVFSGAYADAPRCATSMGLVVEVWAQAGVAANVRARVRTRCRNMGLLRRGEADEPTVTSEGD